MMASIEESDCIGEISQFEEPNCDEGLFNTLDQVEQIQNDEILSLKKNETEQVDLDNITTNINRLYGDNSVNDLSSALINIDKTAEVLTVVKDLLKPASFGAQEETTVSQLEAWGKFLKDIPRDFYVMAIPCSVMLVGILAMCGDFTIFVLAASSCIIFKHGLGGWLVKTLGENANLCNQEMNELTHKTTAALMEFSTEHNSKRMDVIYKIAKLGKDINNKQTDARVQMHDVSVKSDVQNKRNSEKGLTERVKLTSSKEITLQAIKTQSENFRSELNKTIKQEEIAANKAISETNLKMSEQFEKMNCQTKSAIAVLESQRLTAECEINAQLEEKRFKLNAEIQTALETEKTARCEQELKHDLEKLRTELAGKLQVEEELTRRATFDDLSKASIKKTKSSCILS